MQGDAKLETLADNIQHCDDLIGDLRRLLKGRLPWQRQLLARFQEASGLMQVLRLSIAMERPSTELSVAASDLHGCLRLAELALAGSRADLNMRAAVKLAVIMAQRIEAAFASAKNGDDAPSSHPP